MRRRRLKIKGVIILSSIFLGFIFILLSPLFFINIKLIGNNSMSLDYGEHYSEPGYIGKIFNKDITDKVKVVSNVSDSIGNYKITYSYSFLLYKVKKVRKVTVSDLSGPELILEGDKSLSITIDTEYKEPGYKAEDKLDGDVTDKVEVTNNIDIHTLGDYEVIYEVSDSSGNKTKEVRQVKVERLKPTQMSIKDYTLDGWYDEVKLKDTGDAGDDYFNKLVIVGDSNIMNMYGSGLIKSGKAWALPCLTSESMHTTAINIYGTSKKMKLLEAVEEYKPEIMVISFGTFSTNWITEEVFLDKANALIERIKEISPDTKIILMSLYPIRKGYNINEFKQDIINKYNFLILEMASKHNLKYLDAQEVLKGEDGYANDNYFTSDKFHFTGTGFRTLKNYIKTHALKED